MNKPDLDRLRAEGRVIHPTLWYQEHDGEDQAIHPCDRPAPEDCPCHGACSCHFIEPSKNGHVLTLEELLDLWR